MSEIRVMMDLLLEKIKKDDLHGAVDLCQQFMEYHKSDDVQTLFMHTTKETIYLQELGRHAEAQKLLTDFYEVFTKLKYLANKEHKEQSEKAERISIKIFDMISADFELESPEIVLMALEITYKAIIAASGREKILNLLSMCTAGGISDEDRFG